MITSDFKIFNQFDDCIIVAKSKEEIIYEKKQIIMDYIGSIV